MSSKDIIIGSVPYLNARPLTRSLEQQPEAYTIVHHPPAVLAEKISAGEIHVGIMPVAALLASPGMRYVPGVSISCRERSDTVRLVHRKPVEKIRTVGLDAESRSSNMLLRVLMEEHFHLAPEYRTINPRENAEGVDAFVVIGDAAFRYVEGGPPSVDLGAAWHELTGLPFVFAVWGVKGDTDLQDVDAALIQAAEQGPAEAESIAIEEAQRLGISEDMARRYLTETLIYTLGDEEQAGMEVFRGLAAEYGLLPEGEPAHAYG